MVWLRLDAIALSRCHGFVSMLFILGSIPWRHLDAIPSSRCYSSCRGYDLALMLRLRIDDIAFALILWLILMFWPRLYAVALH